MLYYYLYCIHNIILLLVSYHFLKIHVDTINEFALIILDHSMVC